MSADEDRWDFYFARVDERPASIFLNMTLARRAPVRTLPRLLAVIVPMLQPREDGLSSAEESLAIRELEDSIASALEQKLEALQAGRVTTAGRRDLIFYAPEEGSFDIALSGVAPAPYELEPVEKPDPEWLTYREYLYPSPLDRRWMHDRDVVDALAKHGDVLTRPRPIDHVILFPSAAARDAFIAEVKPLGFADVETQDAVAGDHRFELVLKHVSPVELHVIHEVVRGLFERAERHGGSYDGWGCTVES